MRVFLPFLDLLRTRNPCFLFLLTCDGWYSAPYTAKRFWWSPWAGCCERRDRIGDDEGVVAGESVGRSDERRDLVGEGADLNRVEKGFA